MGKFCKNMEWWVTCVVRYERGWFWGFLTFFLTIFLCNASLQYYGVGEKGKRLLALLKREFMLCVWVYTVYRIHARNVGCQDFKHSTWLFKRSRVQVLEENLFQKFLHTYLHTSWWVTFWLEQNGTWAVPLIMG